MKKSLKLFLLAFVLVPFFVGCTDDDEITTPKIVLQGDVTEGASTYVVYVNVTCPEDGNLDKVSAIYYYNDGKSSVSIENSNIKITKTNSQAWLVGITVPKYAGNYDVEKLGVTAYTKDGGNVTESFNLIDEIVNPTYDTFTVTMGGSSVSTEGSYLSIKDKDVYKIGDIKDANNNVEIVFTGTKFISASASSVEKINKNNHSAIITPTAAEGVFSFTTSTGYEGSLSIIEGNATSASSIIRVTVIRTETAN